MPQPSTIPELLQQSAATFSDRLAIEDGDTRLTFAELADLSIEAAGSVRALGIEPGDRVAIWAPNRWEWIVAALGIHGAGGVLVPINTRYKGDEARYIVEKAGVNAIFTVDDFLGLDFASMLDRPDLPTVIFPREASDAPQKGRLSWEAFLAGRAADSATVSSSDLSDILFTSGTTGRPKGVMCTHAQTLRAYIDWSEVVNLQAGDRYLVVAPFFHCFGYKAGWLACLMRGATILPQATFDPIAVLDRIPRDHVTVLPGPPALYQTLLQADLAGHDLSSLRLAVTGAATIPVQLIHQMRDVLGFDTVITGYGLTECTGVVTMCRHNDEPETIATTSGRAIPGVEAKVVDPQGSEQPRGTPGEVVVRGYNVMKGYFDDPTSTSETIRDGWLHTGDVGVMDTRGYLRITDRIKDMFIVGGFNAYPAEIEHTLLEHPAVGEVAVIGVPDPRLGEVGMAFVVRRTPLESDELLDWAKERLANFKVPRQIRFMDTLPRNASAKVMKFELRQMVV